MVDRYLAMNSSNSDKEVVGIETIDPAFGLPALWVDDAEREKAEMYGYTIVDPPSVIATHLTEIVKRYSYELLGRQDVQLLLDNLREKQPALVDDVVPSIVSVGDLQKILSNLLREGISIRDLGTILETISDYGDKIHDTEILAEYVRQGLRRAITQKYAPDKSLRVITVAPALEQTIMDSIQRNEQGAYLSLEPQMIHDIFKSLRSALERVMSFGIQPIVLTAPQIRLHFKHLTEQMAPDLVVLSYGELEQNIEIQSDGVVSV